MPKPSKDLSHPNIKKLIMATILTETQLLAEMPLTIKALKSDKISNYLLEGKLLTLRKVRMLTRMYQIALIEHDEAFSFFMKEKIFSFDEMIQLSENLAKAFENKNFRDLFTQKPPVINPEDIWKLTPCAMLALQNKEVQALIQGDNPRLRKSKLFRMALATYTLFANDELRHLIFSNHSPISLREVFQLSNYAGALFEYPDTIPAMLANPPLLPYTEPRGNKNLYHLRSEPVRRLLLNGRITLNQILNMGFEQHRAIDDADTVARILRGELTMGQVLGNTRRERLAAYNNAQSTHTASVHRSASDTALKLYNRYQDSLHSIGLKTILQQIKDWAANLAERYKEQKAYAAYRCLVRLQHPEITYIDKISNLSLYQFLALGWLAIHDESKRLCSLPEAQEQFKQMLYEIQRGYNLNEKSEDDNDEKDKPICTGGTFNKICEKLVGVHPDSELIIITKASASAKLARKVQEKALIFLKNLSIEKDKSLLEDFKTQGLAVIWDFIKTEIHDEIFEEFGNAFDGKDKQNKELVDLIEAGIYVEVLFDVDAYITEKSEEKPNTALVSENNRPSKTAALEKLSFLSLCAQEEPLKNPGLDFKGLEKEEENSWENFLNKFDDNVPQNNFLQPLSSPFSPSAFFKPSSPKNSWLTPPAIVRENRYEDEAHLDAEYNFGDYDLVIKKVKYS